MALPPGSGDHSEDPILYVSWAAPPAGSGSAVVLSELARADEAGEFVFLGAVALPDLAAARAHPRVRVVCTELRRNGGALRGYWPLRALALPAVVLAILAEARRHRPGRIVAVFPDALYCSASLAAACLLRLPLTTWFHNNYSTERRGLPGWWARRLEPLLVKRSDAVLFISARLLEQYAARYPAFGERFAVARHPVGHAEARRLPAPRGFESPGGPVRALLIGNLNESNLDAATRMVRALSRVPGLSITLTSGSSRAYLRRKAFPLDLVEDLGFVDDAQLAKLLEQADLFLLPHGLRGALSELEYLSIFPTRLVTYLRGGRPILAQVPAGSEAADFLARHRCAAIVHAPEEDAIVEAFRALQGDAQRQLELARAAQQAGRQFDAELTKRALREGRVKATDLAVPARR